MGLLAANELSRVRLISRILSDELTGLADAVKCDETRVLSRFTSSALPSQAAGFNWELEFLGMLGGEGATAAATTAARSARRAAAASFVLRDINFDVTGTAAKIDPASRAEAAIACSQLGGGSGRREYYRPAIPSSTSFRRRTS